VPGRPALAITPPLVPPTAADNGAVPPAAAVPPAPVALTPAIGVAQPVAPGRLPFEQRQPVSCPLAQLDAPLVSPEGRTSEAQPASPNAHSKPNNSPERAPTSTWRIRTQDVWSQARLAGHPFGQPERQSTP
jgi:hypothetical protein